MFKFLTGAGLIIFAVLSIMIIRQALALTNDTSGKIEKGVPQAEVSVINGGFESEKEFTGWFFWSEKDLLTVEPSTTVVKEGRRSVKLEYPDIELHKYHDWSFKNIGRKDVKPGQVWTASAWVKYENTGLMGLQIMAISKGDTIPVWSNGFGWASGFAAVYGTGDWKLLEATATVPKETDQIYVRFTGVGKTTVWIDDVNLYEGGAKQIRQPRPDVEGWAFGRERVEEKIGRGLACIPRENGSMYLSWRLLKEDPENVAFNIYRATSDGQSLKLNEKPIIRTTDFVDNTFNPNIKNSYFIRSVTGTREYESSEEVVIIGNTPVKPYTSIKLENDSTTFQRIGIGDLNGDGKYDYVIKTPDTSLDPWHWYPGKTTYKLEAYLSDGTFLWRKDLGWNIEAGIWYSPYVVYDFNGDGRAEIAVKTAPMDNDYRETKPDPTGTYEAGRVISGPEYLSILDGMTGEELARTDWLSRDGLGMYHHVSRNQLGIAYPDGKTPCLIMARGTYSLNKLAAFQFQNNKLEELWRWDSTDEPGGLYFGQGSHCMHGVDLNGDGKDAILFGSAAIDSNGQGLWSTGLGHSDNVWVGDIDPTRPGLEIYYGIEGSRAKGSLENGISLWDAQTGELIWGLDKTTQHIHGTGLCANIDPRHKGMECYSGEKSLPAVWLHTAKGELIADEKNINLGTSPRAVYWDAGPERELLIGKRLFRYPDETIAENIEGSQVAWVDLLGDWREEIITSVPGEIRIYHTSIPAKDRRITLVQDPLYRNGMAHFSTGYIMPPQTGYFIEMAEH